MASPLPRHSHVLFASCGQQLKRLAAAGKLVRVKASFKLSEELKKVR